jgi:hypothetical protein
LRCKVTSGFVMQPALPSKNLWKKQIPTIVGLSVLVIALVAGVFLFSQGTGVFAPRATPQTTPKNIKITNVTDNSFSVSFLTDESTSGFIKYGTETKSLNSQAGDDRDQLSGSVGSFTLHHITVRGLQPETNYYFTLGTGTQAQFDNGGSPFTIKTAKRGGAPSAAKTIYGNILNPTGGPAEGSIVYVSLEGVGEMSSLVKGSGSWAVPLSNARTTDGSRYAEITDESTVSLMVQGPSVALTSQVSITVAQAQPVSAITLGQNTIQTATPPDENATLASSSEEVVDAQMQGDSMMVDSSTQMMGDQQMLGPDASDSATTGGTDPSLINPPLGPSASDSAELASTPATGSATTTPTDPDAIVDLKNSSHQTISSSQPTITGKVAPNVVVTIKVNSETQIEQQLTTDANGEFTLDISQLDKELEPGEHSVEYSYTDPATGQVVTKTKTFTVNAPANQLASADTSTTAVPYGSGNPYPVGGTASTSASPSPSPTATSSATVSARTAQTSTSSGMPAAGSVGTTMALVIGGLFFTLTGAWSFWVSQQLKEERA